MSDSQVSIPFEAATTMCVSGASRAGKTTWVIRLLKNMDQMYTEKVYGVLWCYSIWQPKFDQLEREIPNIQFHRGIPSEEMIEQFADGSSHKLMVIDDQVDSITKSETVQDICLRGSHHRRLSLVYMTQNLFFQGRYAKSIQVNTCYNVLLANPRDVTQIATLSRQVFPHKSKAIVEAFEDITTHTKFGYLVVDTSPYAKPEYKLRTNIFPGETPTLYLAKS